MAKHRLKSGVELTDELLEELVAEAEAGYDPADLKMVPVRGRPRLGEGHGPSQTIRVRVDDQLAEAVKSEATRQKITLSEYVRRVLRENVPSH